MQAGPILARELLTTPRRPRHYILRSASVGLVVVLMWTAWQAVVGLQRTHRLGDAAHFNAILFQLLAFTQLSLTIFAAALYGASSISYEKDRRTFILLLATHLTSSEIVIEKFLCGMLQVGAVLLAALPAYMILALFGGVSFDQIFQFYFVCAGTALYCGALGVLIAAWRERTFQTVALTLLAVVLSFLAVEILLATVVGSASSPLKLLLACLSPTRALVEVITQRPAAVSEPVVLFCTASNAFFAASSASAFLFLVVAIVKLRDWNPRGEPLQQSDTVEKLELRAEANARAKPHRHAWDNPVLWREIRTRAYGARPIIVKIAYLTVFALLYWNIYISDADPADPRVHLAVGAVMAPLAILSLLLINAQSVASVNAEQDLKSLDLLLATDITPKEFVYGKLFGVLYNTKEMILAPAILLASCVGWGLVDGWGFAYSTILFGVFVAFASILGIHAALRYESTKIALANSLGTMFLLFVGIIICLVLILESGRFEAQWASFILFIVIGSIGLWISLGANAPSNAIGLTAAILPFATFYCIIAFLMGDRAAPFLVGVASYGFAVLSLIIPLLSEFDVATGRTTIGEG